MRVRGDTGQLLGRAMQEGMGWPGLSRSGRGPSVQKAPTRADILCLQGINFNEHLCK